MTATTATGFRSSVPVKEPGFGATLASEWTKLISLRSTYITLGIAIFLSIGMTALISLAVGTTFDEWTPADQASFEPIMFSLSGILFSMIALAVLGVQVVTSEYSSKMSGLTFTVTPRRSRVLAAKILLVAIVTMVAGAISLFGMFLVGQAVLGAYDMPTVGLGDSDALRALIGLSLSAPLFPVIGAAFGFMLRSTAGAITAVLGLIWLPEIFGAFLPRWWQENVISLLPGYAADSLSMGHLVEGARYIENTWLAALVVVAWLVIFIGGALVLLNRRDI